MENAGVERGVENAGVEKAGVDSRGGKCRSDNIWKAVRIENSKIPVVYAQTVCERCSRRATWCMYISRQWTDSRFEQFGSSRTMFAAM